MNLKVVTKYGQDQQKFKIMMVETINLKRSRSRDKLIKNNKKNIKGLKNVSKQSELIQSHYCDPKIQDYQKLVTNQQQESRGEGTTPKEIHRQTYPENNDAHKDINPNQEIEPPQEILHPGDCPHFKYRKGQIFKQIYMAQQYLADGTFGRVLRVENINTTNKYAMKVIKAEKRHIENAKMEVDILMKVHSFPHTGKSKVVKIIESFPFGENFCIIFEELGKSLYDTLLLNDFCGFPMKGLRCILKDLLKGISFMHEIGLTHTDLKPENILFSTKEMTQIRGLFMPTTFNIKIVDFGGATFKNEHHSSVINTRQYRAPEVLLGCQKWDEKSDIWCIACIAIELYTGDLYFSTRRNDFEHLAMIEKSCEPMPQFMVAGIKNETKAHFDLQKKKPNNSYLKWPIGQNSDSVNRVNDMKLIEQLIPQKHEDFINLLRKMMVIDPKDRISALDCLKHQFFLADI